MDINVASIKNLINQGSMEQALKHSNLLVESISDNRHANSVILLSGRLNRLQNQQDKGIISDTSYNIEWNKISNALLSILDTIERDYPDPEPIIQPNVKPSLPPLPSFTSLSGQQFELLIEAMVGAFPTLNALRLFARTKLNQNLNAIVGEGGLQDVTFNLITHYESNGQLSQLVEPLYTSKHEHPKVQAFVESLAAN